MGSEGPSQPLAVAVAEIIARVIYFRIRHGVSTGPSQPLAVAVGKNNRLGDLLSYPK